MAKKIEASKTVLERTYNVPLRKEYMKVPRWKKTKKASIALRQFLVKHMKSEDVKIGHELNNELWKHGIKNPPHHVKVTVSKDEEGVVKAELFGVKKVAVPKKEVPKKVEEKKAEEKKEIKEDKVALKEKAPGFIEEKKESIDEKSTEESQTAKKEEVKEKSKE